MQESKTSATNGASPTGLRYVIKSIKTEDSTKPTIVLTPNLGPNTFIPIIVKGIFNINPQDQ